MNPLVVVLYQSTFFCSIHSCFLVGQTVNAWKTILQRKNEIAADVDNGCRLNWIPFTGFAR